MRKVLVVVGVLAVVLPLLRGPRAAAQEQAQVQRDATGNPIGVLGPVNALGQEIKRPPARPGRRLACLMGRSIWEMALGSSRRAGAIASRSD
jgi:hypothetical protein